MRRTSSVGSVVKLGGPVCCDSREIDISSVSGVGLTVGESHSDEASVEDWLCLRAVSLRARRDNQVHTILSPAKNASRVEISVRHAILVVGLAKMMARLAPEFVKYC